MSVIEGRRRVGPVLEASAAAEPVLAALRAEHPDLECVDRGAYWRVLVEGRCHLSRARVEELTGQPFRLPADLEKVMPSFTGTLVVSDDDVYWDEARP